MTNPLNLQCLSISHSHIPESVMKAPVASVDYKEHYFTPKQLTCRNIQWAFAKERLSGVYSILWMTRVLVDGLGDLVNCLNAVRLVKQEYPTWAMRILIHIEQTNHPIDITEYGLNPQDCLVIPKFDEEGQVSVESDMFINRLQLSRKGLPLTTETFEGDLLCLAKKIDSFIDFIKTSDLQISVSTNVVNNVLGSLSSAEVNLLGPNYIFFQEYTGYPKSFDSGANMQCMGLTPSSSGIYVLTSDVSDHFINPDLRKYFGDGEKTYFNYGWDIQGYASLVNRLNPNAREIKILTNASSFVIEQIHLKGVQTLIYVNKKGEEKVLSQCNTPGKVMRFIKAFPMEHRDMLRAIHMSEEPVGVTGNCTFSESLNRLPFYNNRLCTNSFWKGLIFLAKHATPEHQLLIEYLKQMTYRPSPTGDVGKSSDVCIEPEDLPVLIEQWRELVQILRRDWDVKNAYLGEINRRLFIKEH